MKNKRTIVQFFNNVKSNDYKSLNNADIDDNIIFKHIKSDTEVNYN